jgi:hypothetical protein
MAKRKRRPSDKPKPKFKFKPDLFPFTLPSSLSDLEDGEEVLTPQEKSLTPIEQRWLEFEAADYEEQLALCHQTIKEKSLMDDEMAFEMFNTLYYKTVEHNERYRFEELAHKLQEQLPEIFDHEAHYLLDWQLTNALAEGRTADILPLALALAPWGGQHLDQFTLTLDRLDYHGQLAVLLKIMPLAWPEVKNGTGYFDWAIDEFAARAADYVVFGMLELDPALEASNPNLQEKLGFYLEEVNPAFLTKFLDRLTGRVQGHWQMNDFGFERGPAGAYKGGKSHKTTGISEQSVANLNDLCLEFLRYLHHEEGVSYPKGRLAYRRIYKYLVQRHAGELEPEENIFETTRRGRAKPKSHPPEHWLCPDRGTFDRFLARSFHILSAHYYEAVTALEVVPAWLRFLETRQLITADQRARTLQALRGLDTELLKILKTYPDPALAYAIEQWRENQ